jgi:hypothetical protein
LIAIETVGSWEKIAAEVSELAVAVAPDVILDLIRADPAHPDASLAPHLGHADLIYQRQSSE